ncbi:late blight resistance homolog R1A-3 isoform X1 [Olea europaea subsp. europaea]|uniref:Late blight resistance homolog R1A-3 isoform X1 n=2 Tax=Olea europaea subsp. europaea TaxID=158383 RepID=A0A8S0QA39_OLEEU|nr:late blight resistance homolog R1A-3 isoform X1 [Olea europaea subsp. europaea]
MIVSEYMSTFSCQLGLPSDDFLDFPNQLTYSKDIENIRHCLQQLLSCGKKLEELFNVPNQQSSSCPNEVVAVSINFLLRMVESILCFKSEYIAFQDLRTELGFLITFLGDTSMHLQPTKNIVLDIQDVVNEVGNLFYSLFFTFVVFSVTRKEATTIAFTRLNLTDIEDVVNDVLEDRPLQIITEEEEIWKAMVDINALVHEIGSFIVFTKNDQVPESGTVDLALSGLLPKFKLLKSKIKEHCITVSKMPIDMAPKTGVVSLFIVDSVLVDLMDLINNKSNRILGLNDQIVMLHEELFLLGSSVTRIAVQQEAEQEELIIKTKDVAFEVEYVINSFPPVWYLALRLPQLIEKIQLITMAIKEMKNDIDVAGVREVAKYPDEHLSLQSEETPILEDVIVGFKDVALEIAEQLVRGKEQLQIISISGMPGVGKTTLANKLFNDPSVVYHFYKRALCVVSQTYNKKNVLMNILSCIKNVKQEPIAIKDEESLAEGVYKSLKGRRYLIVLDDIWDTKLWDDLKRFCPDDGTGSRILFTTRNKEVSLKVSPYCVMNTLPFLSEVECWDLLQKKVFRDKSCPQELLDVGKKIAKKCHGLPLAVVAIAGVLANMENKEYLWQEVARNLSSHLSKNSDYYIQILELSYNHLPMHLKPCFLYFGAFKEDEESTYKS